MYHSIILDQQQRPTVIHAQSKQQQQQQHQQAPLKLIACAGCGRGIRDRFYLHAVQRAWHEDCLKCSCCDCRLGELGSTLFTKADLLLCRRDYLRLFGSTGCCVACSKSIPSFELVMRAQNNVYHLECFACQHCGHRFCVGDRFYLHNNQIRCESCYAAENKVSRLSPPPPPPQSTTTEPMEPCAAVAGTNIITLSDISLVQEEAEAAAIK